MLVHGFVGHAAALSLCLPGISLQAQQTTVPSPVLRPPAHGTRVEEAPPYTTPPATAEGVLREMSDRAAVIFAGTVVSVCTPDGRKLQENSAAGIVVVTFSVDQAIRGVTSGDTYVLREWAGLWRDAPRFAPGDRRLMLLHAPGPGGLSSPIDGLNGAIPLIASSLSQGQAGIDLRWLQARAFRVVPLDPSLPVTAGGPIAHPGPHRGPGDSELSQGSASSGTSAGESASPPLSLVLGRLAAWRETVDAAR